MNLDNFRLEQVYHCTKCKTNHELDYLWPMYNNYDYDYIDSLIDKETNKHLCPKCRTILIRQYISKARELEVTKFITVNYSYKDSDGTLQTDSNTYTFDNENAEVFYCITSSENALNEWIEKRLLDDLSMVGELNGITNITVENPNQYFAGDKCNVCGSELRKLKCDNARIIVCSVCRSLH